MSEEHPKFVQLHLTIVAIVLACAPASAATHCVSINTSSPVGIEQTLLAVGTGPIRSGAVDSSGLDLSSAGMWQLACSLTEVPLSVWVDGQPRDARIVTHLTRLANMLPELRHSPTKEGALEAISTAVKLLAAVGTVVEIERMVRSFAEDCGELPGCFRYRYAFSYQGSLWVTRETFVEDGHLVLTTGLSGIRGMDLATLVIDARELAAGTDIGGTLIVQTRFGRLPMVRNLIRRKMCERLWEIERKAQALGRSGESTVLGAVKVFVELVGERGLF